MQRKFVHALLVRRLTIAVILLAVVFAAAVFLVESSRVAGLVADRAQRSVAFGDGVYKSTDGGKTWTNMGLKDLLDRPGLLDAVEFQAQLERLAANARKQEIGRFVYVEINDLGTLELESGEELLDCRYDLRIVLDPYE